MTEGSPTRPTPIIEFLRLPGSQDYRLPEPMGTPDLNTFEKKGPFACVGLRLGSTWGFTVFNRFDITFEIDTLLGESLKFKILSPMAGQFQAAHKSHIDWIGVHPNDQWINGLPLVKIMLPFYIRTSEGLAVWIKGLPNRANPRFNVIEGFIESDTMKGFVSYKAMLEVTAGTTFTIKRGEPLAQIVPFPLYESIAYRQSPMNPEDMQLREEINTQLILTPHLYAENAKQSQPPMLLEGKLLGYSPKVDPNEPWDLRRSAPPR